MPAVVVTCACNFVTALLVLAIIIHLWHMALYMSHGSHYIWTQNTIFRIFIDEAFSYRYKCKWETENLRLLCKCSDFHGCNKCKLNINTLLCIFQLCILGKKIPVLSQNFKDVWEPWCLFFVDLTDCYFVTLNTCTCCEYAIHYKVWAWFHKLAEQLFPANDNILN